MPKRIVTKVLLSVMLVIVTLIQGCIKIEHTKKLNELNKLVSHENVIVLLRVRAIINEARGWIDSSFATDYFAINIKDASHAAKITAFASPSNFADSQGWVYVTLSPGNYSINIIFYTGRTNFALGAWYDLLPTYDIEIPKNQPIVYIGSFRCYCKTMSVLSPIYIPTTRLTECQRVDIKDETNEALSAAKKHFSQWGPPAISLAH